MSRTTSTLVKSVVEVDSDIELSVFINAASRIVDRVATCATAKSLSRTDAELKDIETFLAAHLYSIRDQRISQESLGEASATYQGKTGMYLESTHYGQTAMMLDTSGCLSEINEDLKRGGKKKISLTWLGTERTTDNDTIS